MDAAFLVQDEKKLLVDPSWEPQGIDTRYYHGLLEKAYDEVLDVALRISRVYKIREYTFLNKENKDKAPMPIYLIPGTA